jgi:cobalt-zinc-cadmium efflux system outer membrane protein
MHRKVRILLLAVLVVSAGCRVADEPADGTHSDLVHRKPAASPVARPDDGATAEPAGVITLRDALALAVSRSPELRVYPYELRAADARAMQRGLRPNPELGVEIEEFAGSGDRSGFDGAETTVRIDQPIELGGKRVKRVRVAQFDKELTEWDYKAARLDVVREATQSFVAVQAAQDRVALARKGVELSEQAHAAVARRVQAGQDSPVDELRAGVALSTSRIELLKAEKTLAAARHALAAVWGGRAAAFDGVAGDLYEVSRPAVPEDRVAAIAANPDVARWESQEQRQRAVLQLEKANATPDVTVGGGVQRFEETDDSALVLGLSVPIPLFDRNQGGIREAVAELGKSRRQYEAVQVRTLAALSEAARALAAAYDEVTILRDDVLPKAQQAFESARQGYEQGKFDYLTILDAQRTLFGTQAQYLDSVEAYHKARADVQRLIGEPADASDKNLSSGSLSEPLSQEYSHEK